MPSTRDFSERLRAAGLRVTRQRLAVLDAAHEHPHADADRIFDAVGAVVPGIGRHTVYDILHALSAHGLLRRIRPAGFHARYEVRVGDNHHHLVCRSCAAISDVDHTIGDSRCLSPVDDAGFDVDEADVVFWGLCRDCSTDDPRQQP
ncbi:MULTISPECIES: Fur family transcriptional regulator [Rhodococcus]|uniref:Fur family transcriptional regulator n=1 Tax=Rhodococcus TaxID=1827 RepID=UPI000F277B2C|nr:Fur family transcriptional regulator [Rhodococcus pyridinivorans]MCD2116837.1 transcriptional repressor [Rhodococcus pyridinivorans]MCD2139268.1 transcriptional repressor [Rhodococcus pyridinivorans]MCZ4625955.1 Fur family transcriptional regulator [Rhodococcus pyridinivorans]MCZ4646910.1 Fur family transcriptional regulator [Rhodococcus pyridinivorans]MDJ0480262.1 Fur family transcriptional regulator [Rhodococcus pyridinivorans]